MMRNAFERARRRSSGTAAALCLSALFLALVPPAGATVKAVSVAPPAPGTCDSVSITVAGDLPSTCYDIVGATIRGPETIPCMTPGPCPSRFLVEITVREPNPLLERPCAIAPPYSHSFSVGILPAGEYAVIAHERVIPFAADSTDSIVAESFANATFFVRPDSTCSPNQGCYILSFAPSPPRPFPVPSCTATAPPGGIACLSLNLMNTSAVGGLQTTIEVTNADGTTPADPFIHAVSVDPILRAAGFQVGWTAQGSRTRILLYSTTPGASIPPDAGPVIRICYSIAPETSPQIFWVFNSTTIVADPAGEAIPPCPTLFAPIAPAIICVGSTGCDVNGDGVSDVLDVIRMVRCALAAGSDSSEACPDSIAARADCNGDGSVDIRDVICCVRKIVGSPRGTTPVPPLGIGAEQGNAIGFVGPIRWIGPVDGVAEIRIDAAADWGGTQFWIDPGGAPVRIRGLKLIGATATDQFAWAVDADGIAHAMLYAAAGGTRPARGYRVEVALERLPSGLESGVLRIENVKAGTFEGTETQIVAFSPSARVEAAPVASPMLLGARPNPSAGPTEIGFALPADARVSLHVYDIAGRLVRTLIDGPLPAGVHRTSWDGKYGGGRAAVSGLYFVKLKVGPTIRSERILLLR